MSRYNWVTHEGTKLYQVGILPDGTLHNPNGYPDELVRTAVLAADQRKHERRSNAAKDAAVTRQRRQRYKVHMIAKRLAAGGSAGPALKCSICHRRLSDAESIARGVGSECWQGVLDMIEQLRAT